MNQPAKGHHRYSYEEYLSHEATSNVKHEFFDGEIYAMAGGSRQHAALSVAVSALLFAQLRGKPCVVHSSDLKVAVLATKLCTYPDVTVICGPPQEDPQSRHVVVNPTLLVEITSPSSEEWDRGEKLAHYKKIESLQACLLVSHTEKKIDLVLRQADNTWTTVNAGEGDVLDLAAIGATLAVSDVYASVELASA